MNESIYDRLGGENAISVAVDMFYDKVLADPRINHFFQDVDMKRQSRMQKAFLTFAFGGPQKYTGSTLRNAHTRLVEKGLNDGHFDAVMEHLGATLKELNVPDALISEAAAIAESVRNDVLCKTR
ncbi:MAG: group 1 truncated hemoglobin [Desulfobulbaceae bacterium]|nr:group 1 truncated hemoglobin [Desulfobulbaceae bacterium]